MLALLKALAATLALLAANKREGPFVPVRATYGFDSSVTRAQVLIADSAQEWNLLWATHRGTQGAQLPGTIQLADDRPAVDFEKYFVLGIFGGTLTEVEGYEVVAVGRDDKNATVRFAPVLSPARTAVPRVTQPFGFVILPKTSRHILVQVPAGRDQWRTIATLDPTLRDSKGR
jgi:hypothetical protein